MLWEGAESHLFSLALFGLIVLALVAGGTSLPETVNGAVVQVAGLALLPWAGLRFFRRFSWRSMPLTFAIVGVLFLIPLMQLIPLPPDLWTQLPGREVAKSIYIATGQPLPWRPHSLTPDLTLSYALSLTTPLVVFLGWMTLSREERRAGLLIVLAVVALSLLLGAIQVIGGQSGLGYFYPMRDRGFLVGFFANRNHEASLFLCAIPLGAALIALNSPVRRTSVPILAALGVFLLITGLAAVRSRAGLILLPPVLLASVAMLWRSGALGRSRRMTVVIGAAVAIALLFVLQFGIAAILQRFGHGAPEDIRLMVLPDLWKLTLEQLPLGSGMGSMELVYRSVERLETVSPAFLNHAHNEYIEILLEAGVPGAIGLLMFFIWLAAGVYRAWQGTGAQISPMRLAGTIVVTVLVVHSVVDYPLRTLAMSAIFAIACAMILPRQDSASGSASTASS